MGIKKLFDLQVGCTILRNLKKEINITNKNICIDSSCIIYKYFHATLNKDLTDEENITLYKKAIFYTIQDLIKRNVTAIWVFDGKRNLFKEGTNEQRKEILNGALLKEIQKLVPITSIDEVNIVTRDSTITFIYNNELYNMLNITPSSIHTTILKEMLITFGIEYIIADCIEAEHLAVKICNDLNYDGVLSTDSDVLMFGGNLITVSNCYYIYNYSEIIGMLNLSKEDFCKVCIMLGCDFCDKTSKIGPKQVLKKYKNILLSDEQDVVLSYVMREIDIDYKIFSNNVNLNIICRDFIRDNKPIFVKLLDNVEYVVEECSVVFYNMTGTEVNVVIDNEIDKTVATCIKANSTIDITSSYFKIILEKPAVLGIQRF